MAGDLVVVAYALVYLLAVVRLTGLVAFDEVTRPLREAAVARFDGSKGWHRKVSYLLGGYSDDGDGCPWCLSIWVAAVVVPVAWFHHANGWLLVPALVLAASQVTGMAAGVGRG